MKIALKYVETTTHLRGLPAMPAAAEISSFMIMFRCKVVLAAYVYS